MKWMRIHWTCVHKFIRIFLFSEMERKLDAFTAYTLLCTKRNGEKKLFLTKGFWTWCAKTLELLWCNFILLFSKEMKLTALVFRKHTLDNYSKECLYSNGVRGVRILGFRKLYELNCMLKNIENSISMEKLCGKMKKKNTLVIGCPKIWLSWTWLHH